MRAELDPWMVFCEMCRRVTEDKSAVLNVYLLPNGSIEMDLIPLDEDEDEEDF